MDSRLHVNRMEKLDKDFNGHDEDGGGPCHTHLVAKGRVRGFVVGLFGEVSSDTLTLVRHCVDMIAYRVWKRSGFSTRVNVVQCFFHIGKKN